MDDPIIAQLRARIERLERREVVLPGSLTTAPELWLVETRKHPDGDYPSAWNANVFPCVGVERVFTPDDSSNPQTITDNYLCLIDDDTAPPGWPRVHCPWYIPPGFRFHAWYDRTRRLFHAMDPPHSLLCRFPIPYGGGDGSVSAGSDVGLGWGVAHLLTPNTLAANVDIYEYGGEPVTMDVWNHCPVRVEASDTKIRHIHATNMPGHNVGRWFVDVDPCD